LGLALKDYEEGNIVKHEHTREKPLQDRTNHIVNTNVAAGLVWTVFKEDNKINNLIEEIKQKEPKFRFMKYGYEHILWQEVDSDIINKLVALFKKKKVYIADGHHRAASAVEYRKIQLKNSKKNLISEDPWQYLLTYIASDHQIRILPYNRVIKKLPLAESKFLDKIEQIFTIEEMENAFNPKEKNEIALCLKGKWYRLIVKNKKFKHKRDSLDVAILQDQVLKPILKIIDPRSNENLFFVGGISDPKEMEKYVTEEEYDIFFNLYPVDIRDLESIADKGGVMPPKSTWFDPKLLSGLILHKLKE
jgi:uncharacterized protein (DUF1015 family)